MRKLFQLFVVLWKLYNVGQPLTINIDQHYLCTPKTIQVGELSALQGWFQRILGALQGNFKPFKTF